MVLMLWLETKCEDGGSVAVEFCEVLVEFKDE